MVKQIVGFATLGVVAATLIALGTNTNATELARVITGGYTGLIATLLGRPAERG